MSNYKLEDLKEGRILVFEDGYQEFGKFGIITYQNPNQKKQLACVYSGRGWDELQDVLNDYKFKLYDSQYPLYSFIELMNDKDYIYNNLTEVKIKTKEELRIEEIRNEINKLTKELSTLTELDTVKVLRINPEDFDPYEKNLL